MISRGWRRVARAVSPCALGFVGMNAGVVRHPVRCACTTVSAHKARKSSSRRARSAGCPLGRSTPGKLPTHLIVPATNGQVFLVHVYILERVCTRVLQYQYCNIFDIFIFLANKAGVPPFASHVSPPPAMAPFSATLLLFATMALGIAAGQLPRCGPSPIPHSNQTQSNPCPAGGLGDECAFACDAGYFPTGRHVCTNYSSGGRAFVSMEYFGGRCERLCNASAAVPMRAKTAAGTSPGKAEAVVEECEGATKIRYNWTDADGPCFRTACFNTSDAALRHVARSNYEFWRRAYSGSSGAYLDSVDVVRTTRTHAHVHWQTPRYGTALNAGLRTNTATRTRDRHSAVQHVTPPRDNNRIHTAPQPKPYNRRTAAAASTAPRVMLLRRPWTRPASA
jgi:hypothetical protein